MTRRMALEVIAILAATGALAGFATAQFLPREYISRVTIAFNSPVSEARLQEAEAETLSAATLTPVVLQSSYYKPQLDFIPVDELTEQIRQNSSIRPVPGGAHIEFTDPDRYATLDMARILIEQLARNAGASTHVVEPVRAGLTGPGPGLCMMFGIGAGTILGTAISALARPRKNSVLPVAQ